MNPRLQHLHAERDARPASPPCSPGGARTHSNASGPRRPTPASLNGKTTGAGEKGPRVGRHQSVLTHQGRVQAQESHRVLDRLGSAGQRQPAPRFLSTHQFDHFSHCDASQGRRPDEGQHG